MSEELPDVPPLPPELDRLFGAERRRPAPPAADQAAVFARLTETLGLPPSPPTDGDAGQAEEPSVPAPPPSTPGSTPSSAQASAPAETVTTGASVAKEATVAVARGLGRAALAKLLVPTAAVAFIAGAGVGAGTHALLAERRPESDAPAAEPVRLPEPPAPAAAPGAKPPADPAGEAVAPPREPEAPGPSPRQAASSFEKERPLIERARTALGRRDPDAAIAALTEHEKLWPRGALAEERDALRVLAEAFAGRMDGARERATKFRAAYPRSVFLPTVDRALAPAP